MVSHWSLSDSKFPQVSRTRLMILAVLLWVGYDIFWEIKSFLKFEDHLKTRIQKWKKYLKKTVFFVRSNDFEIWNNGLGDR